MTKDICMAKTANGCTNTATTHRDDKPVCKTHAKSKNIVWKTHQLTIDGALDQGAMDNPSNTKDGVARIRAALNNKEQTMYTAYVIGKPVITKDEEGNPIKAVFPVIQESSKMRSIEDHIEFVKEHFVGWDSIHYLFFRDEEGNKLYYPRRKNQYGDLVFQEMNMKEGLQIEIRRPFHTCNRCSGTGVYVGHSGLTRINAWGARSKECFACGGIGEVR